jgi:uncharacterized protein
MEVDIQGEQLILFPQKALFWNIERTLFVADLHLGKINHFRKSGIPVPSKANDHNIELLMEVISLAKPTRIIFLGDLFHSHYNQEWEVFGEVIKHFSNISFDLVLGNHDIMSERQYESKGIRVHDDLTVGSFLLTHIPLETIPAQLYNIAGHIHPSVNLRGKGRQSITLPCFYFGSRQGFLPAFGNFTGLARIVPKKDDKVFVIADNKVMTVS